jgi:hypothetical protein
MYVKEEDMRLYLKSWKYNTAQVLTVLAQLVVSKGGRVKPTKSVYISNRNLTEQIEDLKEKVDTYSSALPSLEDPSITKQYISNLETIIKMLEGVDNTPIKVSHLDTIEFVLDNYHYSYQIPSNPLLADDFRFTKALIIGIKYSVDYYSTADKGQWINFNLLNFVCPKKTIEDAAESILNMLLAAPESNKYEEYTTIEVANTYDGGFHHEKVKKAKVYKEITF